tara:strand:- start:241 stop:504 length:264 start_codon:yes stop_codon:yes gene_type:complete
MKQTAIQQAIVMVRKRIESMNETLMGKHTAHNLQQVERDLWGLLKEEKEQIKDAYQVIDLDIQHSEHFNEINSEEYYKDTYGEYGDI